MRANPMLKALDNQIATLKARRDQIEGQLQTLEAMRVEFAGLVRKRWAAPKPARVDTTTTSSELL